MGTWAKDTVTGFEGRIIAMFSCITGCDQYQLQPLAKEGNDNPKPLYFDCIRLEVMPEHGVMDLGGTTEEKEHIDKNRGCDTSAPSSRAPE